MACIDQAFPKAKVLLLCAILSGMVFQQAQGQTFAEWFKQKSTQKKYLLQQISALMVYRQYAQQGYAIAKGGLGSVSGYISRELAIHQDHYKRLQSVNPHIRNDPQAKTILQWQQDILNRTAAIRKITGLTASEQEYLQKVCAALLQNCDGLLFDLELLLKDNKARLSDEQRLRQLARLHQQMRDNVHFAGRFYTECMVYVRQKEHEINNAHQIKQLYEKDH